MRCMVLREHGFCGLCYARKRGRSQGHAHVTVVPIKWNPLEAEEMAMKRPEQASLGVGGNLSKDDVLHGWLPALHDHLTEVSWEDGKPRKTTTVMLLTENGMWKAWLHDRDSKRNAWVSGASWEDLLETVERSLTQDTLEWRKDTR